jgi:hypothetical protein
MYIVMNMGSILDLKACGHNEFSHHNIVVHHQFKVCPANQSREHIYGPFSHLTHTGGIQEQQTGIKSTCSQRAPVIRAWAQQTPGVREAWTKESEVKWKAGKTIPRTWTFPSGLSGGDYSEAAGLAAPEM